MPKLHVIPGTPAPDTPTARVLAKMRAMPRVPEMLQCPRCGGHEFVETRIGMVFKNGRAQGGTKQCVCVSCLQRGERVVAG